MNDATTANRNGVAGPQPAGSPCAGGPSDPYGSLRELRRRPGQSCPDRRADGRTGPTDPDGGRAIYGPEGGRHAPAGAPGQCSGPVEVAGPRTAPPGNPGHSGAPVQRAGCGSRTGVKMGSARPRLPVVLPGRTGRRTTFREGTQPHVPARGFPKGGATAGVHRQNAGPAEDRSDPGPQPRSFAGHPGISSESRERDVDFKPRRARGLHRNGVGARHD